MKLVIRSISCFVTVTALVACGAAGTDSEADTEHAPHCKLVDVNDEPRLFCNEPAQAEVQEPLLAAPGSCNSGGGWGDGCVDTGTGCSAECWSCSPGWGSGTGTSCNDDPGGSGAGGGSACWVTLHKCNPYYCTGSSGCTESQRRMHCESLRLSTCGNNGWETPWMGQFDYYCQGTQAWCEADSGCATGAAHCYNNGVPNSWSCRCV